MTPHVGTSGEAAMNRTAGLVAWSGVPSAPTPNRAVAPTPNNLRSCVASAIGRGAPRPFGAMRVGANSPHHVVG